MDRPFPALAAIEKVNGAVSLGSAARPGDYIMQTTVTAKLAKAKQNIAAQFIQFEIQ